MSANKRRLKVTLCSSTLTTFLWWGNSDPIEAEDTFEDSIESLYQGRLALIPHKPLDSDFNYPIDSSWTLFQDYSELDINEIKSLCESTNPINKIVEIDCGDISFELLDSDYDGYEGDFYYQLKAEIYIDSDNEDDEFFENNLRDSLCRNLCFVEEVSLNSRFETKSEDGHVIEIDTKKYLLVPLNDIEIQNLTLVTFERKCSILGEFWYEYRENEDFKPFIKYNDVGLPLAWFIASGIVAPLPMAEDYINETFEMFLKAMEMTQEDVLEVNNLNEFLAVFEQKKIKRDS